MSDQLPLFSFLGWDQTILLVSIKTFLLSDTRVMTDGQNDAPDRRVLPKVTTFVGSF